MSLTALAMLALAVPVGLLGQDSKAPVTDVAALERHLSEALAYSADGHSQKAKQSIRAASHCDIAGDAVETKPLGVKTPQVMRFSLNVALHFLKQGQWWRAASISRHLAGCYSLSLFEEARAAMLASENTGPAARLPSRCSPPNG